MFQGVAAGFFVINISQGIVAMHLTCGEIF